MSEVSSRTISALAVANSTDKSSDVAKVWQRTSRSKVNVRYLPGILAAHDGVRILMPNTRLKVPDADVRRFWPRRPARRESRRRRSRHAGSPAICVMQRAPYGRRRFGFWWCPARSPDLFGIDEYQRPSCPLGMTFQKPAVAAGGRHFRGVRRTAAPVWVHGGSEHDRPKLPDRPSRREGQPERTQA